MSARAGGAPPLGIYAAPDSLAVLRKRAYLIGAVAGAAASVLGLRDPDQFLRSYLVAFLYWLSIALGCFAIASLHHLSRGEWGLMIRRVLEAAARTIPLLALLFVPLLLGARVLYPWARPEEVAADPLLRHQSAYLNLPFFALRAAAYFAIWSAFALILDRMSRRQDASRDPHLARRMQVVAAPGLVLYCLAATFASIDWIMALNEHWHSTIFGFMFIGGQAVAAMAFVIVVARYLSERPPMSEAFRPLHFHDYGKLLLTFVVLWAYFHVSQFIIAWQANLPKEASWYHPRSAGGWRLVSLLLVALHFALPCALLLSRELKRRVPRLAAVAGLLLVMRWFDLYWLAAPAFSPDGPAFHGLDLVLPLAIGGLWLGAFAGQLQRRPLLPLNDPFLPEVLRVSER
jgi:hypothetical protein